MIEKMQREEEYKLAHPEEVQKLLNEKKEKRRKSIYK